MGWQQAEIKKPKKGERFFRSMEGGEGGLLKEWNRFLRLILFARWALSFRRGLHNLCFFNHAFQKQALLGEQKKYRESLIKA